MDSRSCCFRFVVYLHGTVISSHPIYAHQTLILVFSREKFFVCSPLVWLDRWALRPLCVGHVPPDQTSMCPCRPSFSKQTDLFWLPPFPENLHLRVRALYCLSPGRLLAQPINQCSCTTATLTRPSGVDALLPADGEV